MRKINRNSYIPRHPEEITFLKIWDARNNVNSPVPNVTLVLSCLVSHVRVGQVEVRQ